MCSLPLIWMILSVTRPFVLTRLPTLVHYVYFCEFSQNTVLITVLSCLKSSPCLIVKSGFLSLALKIFNDLLCLFFPTVVSLPHILGCIYTAHQSCLCFSAPGKVILLLPIWFILPDLAHLPHNLHYPEVISLGYSHQFPSSTALITHYCLFCPLFYSCDAHNSYVEIGWMSGRMGSQLSWLGANKVVIRLTDT